MNPLALPELVANLGSYLDVRDLHSCVQVNRLWNNTLVPFLWCNIDDRLFGWPRLLNTQQHAATTTTDDETETIIHFDPLFEKYGQYINHLTLHWCTLLQAASAATTCSHLRSLHVFDLKDSSTPGTKETKAPDIIHRLTPDSRTQQRHSLGPLLSPMFEGVFRPTQEAWGNPGKQRQYWRTVQLYWMLVRGNQQHLRELHLEPVAGKLFGMVSKEFLYDSLGLLRNLTSLDTGLVKVDLPLLLERIPGLETLQTRLNDPFTKEMAKSLPSQIPIRRLELRDRLYIEEFFLLLRNLPSLDDIALAGFMAQIGPIQDAKEPMSERGFRLEGLHLRQLGKQDYRIIPRILPRLPRLKRISIVLLYGSIARALWTHCHDLEIFDDGTKAEMKGQGQEEVVMPPGVSILSTDSVLQLLQYSPKLRSVRAMRHSIRADYFAKHEWASQDIEILCVRLTGLRPNVQVMTRDSDDGGGHSTEPRVASESLAASTDTGADDRIRRICDRLSKQSRLREVDLGEEWTETMGPSQLNLDHK
ncbi:hypothetical protein BGX29_001391 [Mortierella sp. GBA35]|nr:hypothetical protein BGX29_001391 [Mortierella sp. GBA35]